MRKLIFSLQILFFLNACQTHFPIVSDDITSDQPTSESIACQENVERIELADIDYLLYANQMIDSMIHSDTVQQETQNSRMRLYLSPISHSNGDINMTFFNSSIKNRILRSGLFILAESLDSGDFQLSGAFAKIRQTADPLSCIKKYEEFILQLKDSSAGIIIWSEKKQFK